MCVCVCVCVFAFVTHNTYQALPLVVLYRQSQKLLFAACSLVQGPCGHRAAAQALLQAEKCHAAFLFLGSDSYALR